MSEELVSCLECGEQKKSLASHLRLKHQLSADEYRQKHSKDGTGNDISIGYTVRVSQQKDQIEMQGHEKVIDPILGLIEEALTEPERQFFKLQYKMLFDQSSKDPAADGAIKTIIYNEIMISRMRVQVMDRKKNTSNDDKLEISKRLEATSRLNNLLLQSLNLTRTQKEKDKKSVETTPSRYASAIINLVENFSPEDLKRENEEVLAANKRLNTRLLELRTYAMPVLESDEIA